jgi:sarcosine oxidase subunit beta
VAPAIGEAVVAASFCPTDGHADPAPAVRAFAAAAVRNGARVRTGVTVRAITTEHDSVTGVSTTDGDIACGTVVVAAGLHTPELLAPLGLRLPLAPKIVTVLQTAPLPPLLDQVFGVANADCAGRQERDGRLRVTTGIGDWPHDVARWTEALLMPPAGALADLIARVSHVLPALADARIARIWGGLIDLTPDALPVIDTPEGVSGLIVAAGYSGHGFGLGPMSGCLIADLALRNAPRLDLAAFRLARFDQSGGAQAPLTLHG